MTKQEIIDYVMTTPSNPNKAVLEGMLDSFSDGEGGGSSRVLLYENDALDFTDPGASPIISVTMHESFLEPVWNDGNLTFAIEIDGEEAFVGNVVTPSGTTQQAAMGIKNPGDTQAVSDGAKAGALFDQTYIGKNCVFQTAMFMLNSSAYSGTVHSVKLYKEA